jgi:hypothetical protein
MRLALVLLLGLASPAVADQPPHPEGTYGGVAPGQAPGPPTKAGKPKRSPPKNTLTWIGFEAKEGGARVFLQAASPFEVDQHLEGSTLVIHVHLQRLGRNTGRRVDTRFFENPLAGIVAKPVGSRRPTKGKRASKAGIDVRITFKNPADAKRASTRTATEPDGLHYVYLTFPEATTAATTSTVEAAK